MNSTFDDRRALQILTVGYWTAAILWTKPWLLIPDGAGYYVYARSLAIRGDLAMVEALERFNAWDYFAISRFGHAANVFAIGTGLLWLPFVTFVHLASILGHAADASINVDGTGIQYLYAIAFGTAFYGYLATCLTYRCVATIASPVDSLLAVMAGVVCTPFFFYAFLAPSTSHVPAAFCVALFLYWYMVRATDRHRCSYWIVLGSNAGLCALVRNELVLLGLSIPFIAIVTHARSGGAAQDLRKTGRRLAWFTTATALVCAGQCVVWLLVYGRPLLVPQGSGFLRFLNPQFYELLISSHHGLYSWAPILLLATVGLCLPRTAQNRIGQPTHQLLILLVPQLYVAAIVSDVHAGESFGARRLVSLTPIFTVGLAIILPRLSRWFRAIILTLCFLWTSSLMLAFQCGTLSQALYSTWDQVLTGVARAIAETPICVEKWTPASVDAARHVVESPVHYFSAILGATALAVTVYNAIRWMNGTQRISSSSAAIAASGGAVVLVGGLGVAAARTEPAPVKPVVVGPRAALDFSYYANSRYDSDPFLPHLKAMSRYPDIAGDYLWHAAPFRIVPPAVGHRDLPSVATNCGINKRLERELPGQPARRLHLAMTARSATRDQVVGEIEVDLQNGRKQRHEIVSGREVLDIFDNVPPDRVVARSPLGVIQGVSLPIVGSPTRVSVSIQSDPKNCLAIFAMTLEDDVGRFEPLDLSPIANANHGIDFFLPMQRVNYFPDLTPGILATDNYPFLLLGPGTGITMGSSLTTGLNPEYRQRIPLYRVKTRAVMLLIDGQLLSQKGAKLSRLRVEYDDGTPTVAVLRTGIDVRNYDEVAAEPIAWRGRAPQDLTLYELKLDARRLPRYLWLESAIAPNGPVRSSIAVFAITQDLAQPPYIAGR